MSVLLTFPRRDKGRIRKRRSINTMGRMILSVMKSHGEEVPANVVCIDEPEGPDTNMVERSDAVLLAICVYTELSPASKKRICKQLSFLAQNGDREAQRVWNTLTAASRPFVGGARTC
jgi:hypothetical protein